MSILTGDIHYVPPDLLDSFLEDVMCCTRSASVRAVLYLMRWTGCRVSEAIQVNLDSFIKNAAFSAVKLPNLKSRGKDSVKVVPLSDRVWQRARDLVEEAGGNLLKAHRQFIWSVMRKACRRHGYDLKWGHPHVFRHSRAIELLTNGVAAPIVARVLGHRKMDTTFAYMRVAPVDIYRQISQVDEQNLD